MYLPYILLSTMERGLGSRLYVFMPESRILYLISHTMRKSEEKVCSNKDLMHAFVHGAFLDAGCHLADHGEAGSGANAPDVITVT